VSGIRSFVALPNYTLSIRHWIATTVDIFICNSTPSSLRLPSHLRCESHLRRFVGPVIEQFN